MASNDILQQLDEIDRRLAELRVLVKKEMAQSNAVSARDPNVIPVMLTIGQAAEKTGLSYDHIRRLCLQGQLTFIKAGSKFLINQERLVSFLNGETLEVSADKRKKVSEGG